MAKAMRICCSLVWLIIGCILLIIGIVVIAILPSVIRSGVKKMVPLKTGSETYDDWKKPPFDVHMQFWLFDVTNVDDILMNGVKPSVQERGPYGFKEVQEKIEIEFNKDKTTVQYLNNKTYYYDQEMSCHTCNYDNDKITVANPTFSKLVQILGALHGEPCEAFLSTILSLVGGILETPFITKTPRELIFEGYDDPLLALLGGNSTQDPTVQGILKYCLGDHAGVLNSSSSTPSKVAFFFNKNFTDDGRYIIETGLNDVLNLGEINEWNAVHNDGVNKMITKLPNTWWNTPQALDINGTDGTVYPPFRDEHNNERQYIFVSDICRSVYISKFGETTVDDLPAYQYRVPSEVFNSTLNENIGFCVPSPIQFYPNQPKPEPPLRPLYPADNRTAYCLSSGLMDVSACQPGNPLVVISSPHFLFSDQEVIDSVDGINPVLETHQTLVELEPTTGVVVSASRKLQINVQMFSKWCDGCVQIATAKKMKNVIVPVLWLNESARIDTDSKDMLQSSLIGPRKWGTIGSIIVMVVGFILICLVIFINMVISCRKRSMLSSFGQSTSSLAHNDVLDDATPDV